MKNGLFLSKMQNYSSTSIRKRLDFLLVGTFSYTASVESKLGKMYKENRTIKTEFARSLFVVILVTAFSAEINHILRFPWNSFKIIIYRVNLTIYSSTRFLDRTGASWSKLRCNRAISCNAVNLVLLKL